jgi:hypothetical protein
MILTRNLALAGCLLFMLVQSSIGRLASSTAVRRTDTEAEAIRAQANALKGQRSIFALDEKSKSFSGHPIIEDVAQDVQGTPQVRMLQNSALISYSFDIKTQIVFFSTSLISQTSVEGMARLTEVYLKRQFADYYPQAYRNVDQVTLSSWANLDPYTTELNMKATIVFRTFGNPPKEALAYERMLDFMNREGYLEGFVRINLPVDPWLT